MVLEQHARLPLRLLLVEDSQDDAMLLLRTLQQGGYEPDYQRVDNPAAMTTALAGQTWDVVISDYSMPNFSGPEALRLLQKTRLDLPFIIMSGVVGETAAVEAMKAGAHDYILKGDSARLVPAIQREMRESAMRRQSRQLEAQLLHAQKLENIARLVGGIAHDFNNLLTPILGYNQLAASCVGTAEPAISYIRQVELAARRGANLTRQLLAFSRRQFIEPQVISLNQLISDIDPMLRRLIGEDIDVVTLSASNLGPVRVDPGQMEQLLMNLVINARDAMPTGGRLTVHTSQVDLGEPRGQHVVLTVSDTGTGMSEEVKARLFEPFFTTKESGKGTGLGLATCYGIVRQHGGHMEVTSEQGRGTTFKVFLPRVEEALTPPAAVDSSPIPRGTETVLLAEDDAPVRALTAHVLRESGYTVLEAANGVEALSVAQRDAEVLIHLLLTDLVMPQMGGQELADLLRDVRPSIKVLFTSGHPDIATALRELRGDQLQMLSKPFEPAYLSRKVRAALDG